MGDRSLKPNGTRARGGTLSCCEYRRDSAATFTGSTSACGGLALSENEQEREVLDGFVGSAKARGAEGHTKGALTQTLFVDNFHCFSLLATATTVLLTSGVCCDTGVQAPKECRSSLGLP